MEVKYSCKVNNSFFVYLLQIEQVRENYQRKFKKKDSKIASLKSVSV